MVLTVYVQGLFIVPDVHKIAIQFIQGITTQYIAILDKIAIQHDAEPSNKSA